LDLPKIKKEITAKFSRYRDIFLWVLEHRIGNFLLLDL